MATPEKTPATPIAKEQVQASTTAPVLLNGFNTITEVISDPLTTVIRAQGHFKFRIENNGSVGITILGSLRIPQFGVEIIETGSPDVAFAKDVDIHYDEIMPYDNVELKITKYKKG